MVEWRTLMIILSALLLTYLTKLALVIELIQTFYACLQGFSEKFTGDPKVANSCALGRKVHNKGNLGVFSLNLPLLLAINGLKSKK